MKIPKLKNYLSKLNFISSNRLRYRIILIVSIAILLPTIFFFIYIYTFVNDYFYTRYVDTSISQATSHLEDSIVTNLRIIENTYVLLSSSQNIRENLYTHKNNPVTYYNEQLVKLNIETELKYIMGNDFAFNSGLIASVFIFASRDSYYNLLYNYLPNDILVENNIAFYTSFYEDNSDIIRYNKSNDTLYYMKTVQDYITGSVLGKIIIGINMESLKGEYYSTEYTDWISIIYDSNGIYRFHTNPELIGLPTTTDDLYLSSYTEPTVINIKDASYLALSEHVNDLNFDLVNFAPIAYFQQDFWSILPDYVYFIMFSVLISIIVGIYAVSYITEPLNRITLTISEVGTSNFKAKMPPSKYQELNDLSVVYNEMIDQIQHLFNEVYEKQILVRESELKALHAQINPHFIFNVLESITWEARMSENEKIEQMITSLGQLLRSNLSFSTQEKNSIEQELDYINFYLYLQTVRFAERLSYEVHVESDNLLALYLPKFSIQTLVENAIIHGIEKKTTQSHLTIDVKEQDDTISISVQDDGLGFDTSTVDFAHNEITHLSTTQHIGLLNVDRRIKLLYGEDYGICIESTIGEGTIAHILIPKDEEI